MNQRKELVSLIYLYISTGSLCLHNKSSNKVDINSLLIQHTYKQIKFRAGFSSIQDREEDDEY